MCACCADLCSRDRHVVRAETNSRTSREGNRHLVREDGVRPQHPNVDCVRPRGASIRIFELEIVEEDPLAEGKHGPKGVDLLPKGAEVVQVGARLNKLGKHERRDARAATKANEPPGEVKTNDDMELVVPNIATVAGVKEVVGADDFTGGGGHGRTSCGMGGIEDADSGGLFCVRSGRVTLSQ